jgi:uncharacterized protein
MMGSRAVTSAAAACLALLAAAGCGMAPGEALQPDPAYATVEVVGVGVDPATQSPVVLLREPATEGLVPIWIGTAEAEAIARSLHGVEMPRPMTHDLLASTIERLGARVVEVVVVEQRAGTYYGIIRLVNGARGERVEIDSRPSDALALALRTGAPIRVARVLLRDSLEDAAPPPVVPAA